MNKKLKNNPTDKCEVFSKTDYSFAKGVENLVNPISVGTIHFIQQLNSLLPKKIQELIMKKSSQKTPSMGFVVEPYSSFLCYKIKDIIKDLGIKSIILLTNNPDKIGKLKTLGVTVKDVRSHEINANSTNYKYLKTKKDRMNHQLNLT